MIPQHWFPIFNQHESLIIGFSGGLDSTVLLHLLSQHVNLSGKIKAVHINHGLHPDANQWETHCATLCHQYNIPCFIERVLIQGEGNLEERARIARYTILQRFITNKNCLLTAHHQDDQAETVLLNLMRGTGIAGISAMPSSKPFGEGILYRPLLQTPRQTLLNYAIQHHLHWIDDPANMNVHFSRNFIRHEVLPLLQTRWNASKMLAHVSELAQEAQSNLNDLAVMDYPAVTHDSNALLLTPILHLSESRIKNVIRFWFKQRHLRPLNRITWYRLYHELIHAAPDTKPLIPWDQHMIRRYQQTLYLTKKQVMPSLNTLIWNDFPNPLTIPHLGILHAEKSDQGIHMIPGQHIDIRMRNGGEILYWHGQHQSLKKLMQLWQIPPWERSFVPLLYIENRLASVIGYGIADDFYTQHIEHCFVVTIHNDLRKSHFDAY